MVSSGHMTPDGVRLSQQRELDHPSPNAIQIKECIQRKQGCSASLQKGPYDDNRDSDTTVINQASHVTYKPDGESNLVAQ